MPLSKAPSITAHPRSLWPRHVVALGLTCASFGWALACRNESPRSEPAANSTSSASPSSKNSASAQAVTSTPVVPSETVSGAYETKVAPVTSHSGAPSFVHPNDPRGIGKGTVRLVLPGAASGPVLGQAEGAMGAQTFSGVLEEGEVRGSLLPVDPKAEPAMYGVFVGNVSGSGSARAVHGTVRASSADGRLVREADLSLSPATP